MTKQHNTLELLRDLVGIYSGGVGVEGRESEVVRYVADWVRNNCPNHQIAQFDGLRVPHLLVSATATPKILLACHADTMPQSKSEHTTLQVDGDKIYGLGTKDMKGGIVASLLVLARAKQAENGALLIYGDEEYAQKGMAELAQLARNGGLNLKPEVIVSPESRFNLVHSARGIVVFEVEVRGKRAHSSRPHQGVDAVKLFYQAFAQFESEVGVETKLGKTVTTIARIEGGIAGEDGQIVTQAGMIPDIVRATVSMRNSHLEYRGDEYVNILRKLISERGLTLVDVKILMDHATRQTPLTVVNKLNDLAKQHIGKELELGDPALAGYNDAAILGEVLGAPVVNFGPYGEGNHTADEWVSLKSIEDTADIFVNWVDNF